VVLAHQLGTIVLADREPHPAVNAAVLPHVDVAVVGAPDRQLVPGELPGVDVSEGKVLGGGNREPSVLGVSQ
jgi:hypothetical protein